MRSFTTFVLLFGLCFACEELDQLQDIDDINYDAEFAIPLINSTLSIQDILDDADESSSLSIDENGLLHLIYEGDVLTNQGLSVLQDVANDLPSIIPVLSDDFAIPFTIPNQIDIDQLTFSSGELSYAVQNRNPEPVNVQVTLPQLLREDTALTYTFSLPAYSGSGAIPTATNQNSPTTLSGVQIIPQDDTVYVKYEAVTPDGQMVALSNFVLRINNPTLSYAQGYLGQNEYAGGSNRVEIDFFDQSYIDGTVRFAEPTVRFLIENSFGIPTRAVIHDFAVTTVAGERLPVTGDIIDTGIDFPFPPLTAVGESRTSAFTFDQDNSNIVDLLSSNPLALEYDIDVRTHPDGNSSEKGFLTDESSYSVRLEVDLPLSGQVDQFVLRDTTGFDLGELQELSEAEFKLIADNGIPIDADVQIYFLDEQNQRLDSLFTADLQRINAAQMNADGVSTTTVTTERILPYPPERLDALRQAVTLGLQVRLSTASSTGNNVQIYQNQDITIRLGAIIRVQSE